MDKRHMKQAIVVEGRYDANALRQLVDTEIFETRGFGILNDEKALALLKDAAARKGLVVLTDSDGAGFVIRNYLKGALPKQGVLHAYIPDIPGKERRKRTPGKEGKLGVEGMRPEILYKALADAGAELDGTARNAGGQISKPDLYALGLSGRPQSAQKRAELLRRLSLPAHLSANALLQILNMRYSREEFLALARQEEEL